MKYFIKIFLAYLFILTNVSAQSLWLFDNGYNAQFNRFVENLSVDSLKNIILFDDWNQSPLLYKGAVTRLYYFHKETESQFLINNLATEIDSLEIPEWAIDLEWDKYYTDAYILGHLGSSTAIDKMRVIANDENNYYRLRAIGHLAEAGYYDYYNYLKNEYYGGNKNPYILNLLGWYSRNENYRDEIKTILKNEVYSESDYFGVISKAHNLSFIPGAEVEILDEFFRNKTGKERYDYFRDLGFYDKDGQPERSMFALQNEVNDTFRVEYLPTPFKILNWSSISKRYLEPKFVNYIKTLSISDTNSATYQVRKYFLQTYAPIKPDSMIPTNDLLNNLYNYVDSVYNYTWLGDLNFSNELKNILTTAKTNLQNGDSLACRVQVKAFQDLVDNVYKDSLNQDPRFVTIEGWKFLYWNAQYILDRLPEPPANPNLVVNLKNSLGNQIPASNVMYYEGSWKDAVNNGDGTFTVITTKPTVSIRVFYEGANQTVNNVPAQNNTYTFQTVNAAVQLKNSLGNFIDQGTVQYYAGAWRSFGTTSNGVANKELLPINYSFRMTYEYGSIDIQQDISTNPTVVFQTVNAAVQLKNSLGNLIPAPMGDAGTVQYYAGAWRNFGITSNGVVYKELLPINCNFRMTHEFVSKDKQQNLSANPVVDFSTVLCSVKVSKTSNNEPINNAAVKYYSGAWRNLGTTNATGIATKELLPSTLSFRATLGNVSLDKQQDISVNNLVE
ncbi:MAG TPA: hypothetical protein PLT78_15680, partial [Ignavibacteriaceae bacterium]|nr:hypothetical protein [Ignavibacteriaceae bacterium]